MDRDLKRFKIQGRQVLNSHGDLSVSCVLTIERRDGCWHEIGSGLEVQAQYDEEEARWVLISEEPRMGPFVPDAGELRRIGMLQ